MSRMPWSHEEEIATLHEEIAEYKDTVKAKDAEILALKEQVASLQRVLAHRRDSDSDPNTAPGFEGVLIHKGNV